MALGHGSWMQEISGWLSELRGIAYFGDLDWLIQIDQSENADTWPFTDLIG